MGGWVSAYGGWGAKHAGVGSKSRDHGLGIRDQKDREEKGGEQGNEGTDE